ncbi:MAG: hypothetical protein BYD32DRAFT_439208 [Podila humilis]|nr:MAG: hypothetical protein BYD32DRAFT_439208 [Podila humilis]
MDVCGCVHNSVRSEGFKLVGTHFDLGVERVANAAFLESWFVFVVDVEDLIPVLTALAVVVVLLFGLPLLFQPSRKFDALDPLLGRGYLLGHDGYGEDDESQADG